MGISSTTVRLVLCSCAMAVPLACGPGGAAGGAKSAGTVAADQASAAPAATSPPAADTGPATTTTAVGDTTNEKPSKLAESHTAAPASPGPDAGASAGRGKEPGRGPADLRAMVTAHRNEARACYDKGLADHPGMDGDLVIEWLIDPKGNVSHVTLDAARSQITDAGVTACISAIIAKLQFAPSPGGYETRASYPFNFHPHHATRGATP